MDNEGRPLAVSNGVHKTAAAVSSSSSAVGKSNTAAMKPALKRPGKGIVVSTVKRAPVKPPTAHSPSPARVDANGAHKRAYNALPEETRRRAEELRLERERKAREVEERLRAQQRGTDSKATTKKRPTSRPQQRKAKRRVSSDDDSDDDNLFSASDSTPRKKKHSSSRSQSVTESSCYKRLGRFGVTPNYYVSRDLLNPASFSSTSAVAEDVPQQPIQSADLLSGNVYGPFFYGLDGEARVRLEYPADGASEEFVLLAPKDRDEYDPISDLLRTVRCIIEYYLTEEQKSLFGSLESLETSSTAGSLLVNGRGSATPALLTTNNSRESTPSLASESQTSKVSLAALPLSPPHSAPLMSATAPSTPLDTDLDRDSILRSFTKARNRRDGPLFVRTVERFNTTLRSLKEQGKIRDNVAAMSERGVSEGIWRCIQEQCYARTVAPRVEELSKYEAFSDNVYGELLPRFMSEIAQLTDLGPSSVFVDLGSGVGNLLIQVALQTGSESYGCEQMQAPSELASLQVAEAKRRWAMWGLNGAKTEAWRGDFGEDESIRDVLRRADVILVNNYAFTAKTNDNLSLLFLDLKDGAHIVSLKPFVPHDFRLTERTLSSPLAILRVAQRLYTSGCVSWADNGGPFYIHTVDRSLVARFLDEHAELALSTKGGARKRQWKALPEDGDEEQD